MPEIKLNSCDLRFQAQKIYDETGLSPRDIWEELKEVEKILDETLEILHSSKVSRRSNEKMA